MVGHFGSQWELEAGNLGTGGSSPAAAGIVAVEQRPADRLVMAVHS